MAVVTLTLLLWPEPVRPTAHPLGNFTINHYNGLEFTPSKVVDHAVIDTAEIPTISEEKQVDADGDGQTSATEQAGYAAGPVRSTRRTVFVLSVDGRKAV